MRAVVRRLRSASSPSASTAFCSTCGAANSTKPHQRSILECVRTSSKQAEETGSHLCSLFMHMVAAMVVTVLVAVLVTVRMAVPMPMVMCMVCHQSSSVGQQL